MHDAPVRTRVASPGCTCIAHRAPSPSFHKYDPNARAMVIALFDPAAAPPDIWPDGRAVERSYLEALGRPPGTLITNADIAWRALRADDNLLPVTVSDGATGGSYVAAPHSAYALYARDELSLLDLGLARLPARALIAATDGWLRAARVNTIVHVDNWLYSTNLHGPWTGQRLPEIRNALAAPYPDHIIGIRSVDEWSSPDLLQAARDDGWLLLPSRQIWVTDDVAAAFAGRKNIANDRRALRRSGLRIEHLETVGAQDAATIARLYGLLYLDKYSRLNPQLTPAYIAAASASGALEFRVARDETGTICAMAGVSIRSDVLTAPAVGYDTARPREDGLYRIAMLLASDVAIERSLRLHGSAGAGHFKQQRGARPVTEYNAWAISHLSPGRQWMLRRFAALLEAILVPFLQRQTI